MSIRFTEREKFRDKWYMSLTPIQKCIWEYFLSECDHAGILEFNLKMMSLQIGAEITMEDLKYFEKNGKIIFISEEKIFIPNFILFQQRVESIDQLNPKNRCHKSIIDKLKKYNIIAPYKPLDSPIEAPSKPLIRGYSNSNSISNSNSNSKDDIYNNMDFEKCFKIYTDICKDLIPLRFERRSKAILELLKDFLEEIDYNFEYFNLVCIKANNLKTIMDTKIDFKMLLRNHAGIMNDKYGSSKKTVGDYNY